MNCPKCGARWLHNEQNGQAVYECRSTTWVDALGKTHSWHTEKCLENQLSQANAREARVRELADNYAGEELREGMYTGTTVAQDILEALEGERR